MLEFREFSKIPRLSREITLTEKLDGTSGLVFISRPPEEGTPAPRSCQTGTTDHVDRWT